ncbi:MAG: arginine--tRNA ligase [Eubacteriales bacterium]
MKDNLIQQGKNQVAELCAKAYISASEKNLLPSGEEISAVVEIPKDSQHGDFASSFAMVGAKKLKQNPRKIADILMEEMDLKDSFFSSVSVAGAGFLNFTLSPLWYQTVLTTLQAQGENYGRQEKNGKTVMVEFVSANPTGPMHMGNARGGVLGDTLANVLDFAGYTAHKEFYLNDAGNQIDKFARSIQGRYQQLLAPEKELPFSPDYYQGGDIITLAEEIFAKEGDAWDKLPQEEQLKKFADYGLSVNIPNMKKHLEKYGIQYDKWYLESSLYEDGSVKETLDRLTENGHTYEKDGALWLKTSDLLREKFLAEGKKPEQIEKLELKDDVLRRANGFYTYFAADIAYHRNKLETRSFDLAINVWGADHHGHVARIQVAMDALGLDGSSRLVVVLMQLVNLLQDGKPVRMSKRTGKALALEDLLEEISVDAARFFFNNRVASSSLDFDLDLALRQDAENPVYYVQYAHARICSLLSRVEEEGNPTENFDPLLLNSPEELALIKALAQFPEEIALSARDFDPSRINRYLISVSADFHRFYNENHILGEALPLLSARYHLAQATVLVLAQGLKLLAVSAPQRMTRLEES